MLAGSPVMLKSNLASFFHVVPSVRLALNSQT